jgi:hypothetical protein
MATKDDDKDLEERDEDEDEDEEDSSPPKKTAAAAATKEEAAADEDDDDDDDDEPPAKKPSAAASKAEDDGDDDDDDDDEPPAKPEAAGKAASASAKPGAAASKAKPGAAPAARKAGAPAKGAAPASSKVVKGKLAPAPVKKRGSLGTSMVLFVIVVGGLAAGFAFLGRETSGPGPAAPKWKDGQEVDVEITLVKTDRRDLGCASAEEVGGRHCAFESKEKRWSKPDKPEDKKALLQPYTTSTGVQFLAAGLWTEPALDADGKLPATRFTVKCKYKVEGKVKKPAIRWHTEDPWADRTEDWYSGLVSGCSIIP